MDAATLHDAISEVCPVISVSVGNAKDRATWSFVPAPEATPAQITAGENVIATIPINPLSTAVAVVDFIGRFTNAEYRAATATAWRGAAGNAKNWDVVVFDEVINMTKKKVQTLKTDLVAGGILTAARADEIFK
jgi:hypothetical protein